jgi:hypothetical protein
MAKNWDRGTLLGHRSGLGSISLASCDPVDLCMYISFGALWISVGPLDSASYGRWITLRTGHFDKARRIRPACRPVRFGGSAAACTSFASSKRGAIAYQSRISSQLGSKPPFGTSAAAQPTNWEGCNGKTGFKCSFHATWLSDYSARLRSD